MRSSYSKIWPGGCCAAYFRLMILRAMLLAALAHPARAGSAQQPLNLDFERAAVNGSGGAWGWSLGWSAFQGGSVATFTRDSTVVHGGRHSLRIRVPDSIAADEPQAILLQVPAGFARGHQLRLSGWMRVAPARRDRRAPRSRSRPGRTATSPPRIPPGPGAGSVSARGWTRVLLDIAVPDDPTIHSIVIGACWMGRAPPGSTTSRSRSMAAGLRRCRSIHRRRSRKDLAWLASALLAPLSRQRAGRVRCPRRAAPRSSGWASRPTGRTSSSRPRRDSSSTWWRPRASRRSPSRRTSSRPSRSTDTCRAGRAAPREAMGVLFRVWYTEEVLALVEWLRAWNLDHAGGDGPLRRVRHAGSPDARGYAACLPARAEPSLVGALRLAVRSSTWHRRDPPRHRFPTRSAHGGCSRQNRCWWRWTRSARPVAFARFIERGQRIGGVGGAGGESLPPGRAPQREPQLAGA